MNHTDAFSIDITYSTENLRKTFGRTPVYIKSYALVVRGPTIIKRFLLETRPQEHAGGKGPRADPNET